MRHKKIGMRFAAAALCTFIGISAGFYPAMDSFAAAGYQRVNGYYQMRDGTVLDRVIARGIDVSRWQGNIDWSAVAADDVSFVMLGTRSKGIVDPYFHTNVQGASAAGLKVGAYIYSLATTPEMARAEADFVLDLVKEYPISFPIAFDAEDSATLGTLPPSQVSEVINAFCSRIEEAGYYPIVYANDYWLSNKIDLSQMNYDVWVARYEAMHKYADPIMWQVTSTGSIQGINGNVDIDFLYKDLTPKLPGNLWRTIGGKTYYYQNYSVQKDAWINDGTGWFYMNGDGQKTTGWFEKDDQRYYLDETSGRMATGWKQLSDQWYFFNGSGAMNKGWLEDNGSRYYLNSDGSMASGFMTIDGQRYYFNESSGHMAVGWKNLDGKWYYMHDNGVMATGWQDINGKRYFLKDDGIMATGWLTEGNSKYYLSDSGAMTTGWAKLNDSWYYFQPNGTMATGWINENGTWYYLGADGRMQTGWLDDRGTKYYLSTSSGKMTVGWREIDGSWYYFNEGGGMATGMAEIGGKQYYLNPSDGKMAASTTFEFNGVSYTADSDGVCTVTPQETGDTGSAPASNETAAPSAPSFDEAPKSSESATKEIGPGIR